MTDKTQHILETIGLLIDELDNEEIKMSLVRIADSVAHTAPEIIDNRWSTLFKFCTHYINDENNPSHLKCLEIYNQRYTSYAALEPSTFDG